MNSHQLSKGEAGAALELGFGAWLSFSLPPHGTKVTGVGSPTVLPGPGTHHRLRRYPIIVKCQRMSILLAVAAE
jgi:hypothetical protein